MLYDIIIYYISFKMFHIIIYCTVSCCIISHSIAFYSVILYYIVLFFLDIWFKIPNEGGVFKT